MALKPKFAWHVHDNGVLLPGGRRSPLELLTDTIENRITYIKKEKPKREQAMRLRLLKPVKGKLPAKILTAYVTYEKACAACEKATVAAFAGGARTFTAAACTQIGAAYTKARAAFAKAFKKHFVEIEELHAEECPGCPWDGKTIFAKRKRK